MYVSCVVVIIVFIILGANCDLDMGENKYAVLPSIFHIDHYEKCNLEKKLFCKVSVSLMPKDSNNSSYYWKLIEESLENKRAYNHNELFHAICLQDFCMTKEEINKSKIDLELSQCYTNKYEHLGLTVNITNFNCTNQDNVYKARTVDYVWLVTVAVYSFLLIFATIWDSKNQHKSKSKFVNTFIIPFSVRSNWLKLQKINSNPDFQNLKCIQGIRFYNMLLIIFCHTYSSYIGGYVLNTSYIENIPNNPIRLGIRNLFVFLVQTFFLFSGFLLSYHIFQLIDSIGVYNKKYIFTAFLNRYLRIIPPVVIMIGLGSTVWIVSLFYGPIKDLYTDLEYQRCQKNWWTTLLFINNHYNQHDMCYFITWYLAADTQLYVVSLLILSIIWKYRKKTELILTISVIVGILIPCVITYLYNLDIIYRITPENSKNNKFRSFNFNAIYSSTYANMATYMVGLCFGYIYFQQNKLHLFSQPLCKAACWFSFFGLPLVVVMASSYYYSRFYSAVLSGILKPLYAIGIGIGILGMSQKTGGLVRAVCEWRPALFMGNFTYSTYVVHYGVVFFRTAMAKQPLYISDFELVTSFISDAVLSFFCGFLMHILVEMPALQLQGKLVPQIRKLRLSKDHKKTY